MKDTNCEAKAQRSRAVTRSSWTAAGSDLPRRSATKAGAPRRFGSSIPSPRAVPPLRSGLRLATPRQAAAAVQNRENKTVAEECLAREWGDVCPAYSSAGHSPANFLLVATPKGTSRDALFSTTPLRPCVKGDPL